jgi:hypothetical protein
MTRTHQAGLSPAPQTSPLILADRLLTLAQDADRAGYQVTADRLVQLAHRVFDEPRQSMS